MESHWTSRRDFARLVREDIIQCWHSLARRRALSAVWPFSFRIGLIAARYDTADSQCDKRGGAACCPARFPDLSGVCGSLHHLHMSILETERLLFRQHQESDRESFCEM